MIVHGGEEKNNKHIITPSDFETTRLLAQAHIRLLNFENLHKLVKKNTTN